MRACIGSNRAPDGRYAEIDLPASPYRLLNALDEIGIKSTKEIVYQEILNYCVIFCKCRKRDTGAFESAMNELPRKMLLRGHTDYIQFCEGLKNKIAAAWKSGGELQHEEARPSA